MAGFKRNHKLSRSLWGDIIMLLFVVGFGAFMSLPLVYATVTAFKPSNELFLFPPRFFVQNPTLSNFKRLLYILNDSRVPFGRYIVNSVFVAGFGTVAYIFIASLAAYPLAKHNFKGRVLYSRVVVLAILFRPEVTAVAVYMILAGLGMIDTYWSILLPTMATSFGVFLMQQFIASFPDTILEAARIDGAGEWRIWWSIVMQGVKPGWITLVIFTFQSYWNTGSVGTYIYSDSLRTLPEVLSQISAAGISRAGEGAAVALLLMIPPIVIFILSQNSVMETMAHSGIKG